MNTYSHNIHIYVCIHMPRLNTRARCMHVKICGFLYIYYIYIHTLTYTYTYRDALCIHTNYKETCIFCVHAFIQSSDHTQTQTDDPKRPNREAALPLKMLVWKRHISAMLTHSAEGRVVSNSLHTILCYSCLNLLHSHLVLGQCSCLV